ncbi:hypothetical protein GCM10007977_067620 [Dactylosporangium sucinum]|uniref:Uncharacterized protein n=1 Tax=Dactylosporangium sucinum TaxID=1424081 RepID=A0A917U3V2_9ACTN|nr:hypothetical protein GCM10007977_067620 [Dactylosporangium sucinum]
MPVGIDGVAVHDAIASTRLPITRVRQGFTVSERSGRGQWPAATAAGEPDAVDIPAAAG